MLEGRFYHKKCWNTSFLLMEEIKLGAKLGIKEGNKMNYFTKARVFMPMMRKYDIILLSKIYLKL